MHRILSSRLIWGLICLYFTPIAATYAQNSRPRSTTSRTSKLPDTHLEIQLLTGNGGANRTAQRWSEYFQKMNVAVRIRRATPRDKPGVTEKNIGNSVRRVIVIAGMDRQGRLILPGRMFSLSQGGRLAEWLDELRTYGAQGSPEGQPAWGLTKKQLDQVLLPLKRPLTIDPKGKDLLAAMVLFAPDMEQGDLPIHVTPDAKEIMAHPRSKELFPQSLAGLSRGTALAILLRHYGLCFTPQRTPTGDLELSVRDITKTKQPWKVGWPWPDDKSRSSIAPNLFKYVTVDLEDRPLADVVEAASSAIGIPILVDHAGMNEWHIDYDKIQVTFPRKRTTWGLAIQRIAFQSRLRRELYIDEAGKPFVWLTPIEFKRKPTAKKE
ncbi:hypothetical protein Mal52_43870 [Symmachiella dynata]|uniref:Uncharacterized protein n=1 Tax=Symmachiella dynata TaxID=2527995 RepID=A0A517ZTU3_9PLAN|nr:hypothetical protein [Symmachiella dynata]QDU45890.1 hypothetical protein Mal52_43870 [Symmachiella dynata]